MLPVEFGAAAAQVPKHPRQRDTPCDLGQPRVSALLLGNGSHLQYTTQRELSDRVVFLMNVRGDVQLWG